MKNQYKNGDFEIAFFVRDKFRGAKGLLQPRLKILLYRQGILDLKVKGAHFDTKMATVS